MIEKILPEPWVKLLKDQEKKLIEIGTWLANRRKEVEIYPYSSEIFRAFHETLPDQIRVVIVGQDPYHNLFKGKPVACGLAFAPRDPDYLPPSLKILQKAANDDLGEGTLDWSNLPS